jgi:phage terminase large subunit-like protein
MRFLSCSSDIVVYGGERGGGKTAGLVMDAARGFAVEGYRSMLLRRTYPQLTQPNGIWQTACAWYPGLGGRKRESAPMVWRFPSGAECVFSHLQYEDDVRQHLGAGYDHIGIDQAEGFTERQIWGLWSGLRTTIRGIRPALRLTCNPDPDCYLRTLLDWWIGDDGYVVEGRDGATRWMFRREDESLFWGDSLAEIMPAFRAERADLLELEPDARPISVTFIVAGVHDNPSLEDGYVARLMDLPAVERERYLGDLSRRGANWNVRPAAGNVFRLREWCRFLDEPDGELVKVVRGWDFAGTEPSKANRDPDWTRCLKLGRYRDGRFCIMHGDGCQETPGKVRDMFRGYARADGPAVTQAIWQDPAQSGKDQVHAIMREITGVPIRSRVQSKTKHVAMAPTIASQAEHGNVDIVRGPWLDSFLGETDQFPDGKHDDWIAALCRAYLEIGAAVQTHGYRGTASARRERQPEGPRGRRVGRRANRGLLV